jgi:hypothetical protein
MYEQTDLISAVSAVWWELETHAKGQQQEQEKQDQKLCHKVDNSSHNYVMSSIRSTLSSWQECDVI